MTSMEIFDSLPPVLRRALAYARAPIPISPAIIARQIARGRDPHQLAQTIKDDGLSEGGRD